jgi:hypothetical protein
METLWVGLLNINGTRDVGKRSVKQKKVQVCYLQEMHSDVVNGVDLGDLVERGKCVEPWDKF